MLAVGLCRPDRHHMMVYPVVSNVEHTLVCGNIWQMVYGK